MGECLFYRQKFRLAAVLADATVILLPRSRTFLTRLVKPALAALLVGLLLLCTASSAISSVHHWLHPGGSETGSSCAVCLLLNGLVDVPGIALTRGPTLLFFPGSQVAEIGIQISNIDLRLAPGRAPPSC